MRNRLFDIFKASLLMIGSLIIIASLAGCDDDNDRPLNSSVSIPPPVPQGVYSVTGDGTVYIHWLPIDDINNDFAFYAVYRSSTDPDTGYWEIGTTDNTYFVDDTPLNGYTYYYAVASVDVDGYESDLSYEYVPDTPRPEGYGQVIYDFVYDPAHSGWDLDNFQFVDWQSPGCDFYLEWVDGDGVFYFNVGNGMTDIQDMGYTGDFDEIDYSPPADSGWSENGWCEVIRHHTYVIWTDNNHFAKIRVTSIGANSIIFDWGFQIDQGNRELKPRVDNVAEAPLQENNKAAGVSRSNVFALTEKERQD